MRGWGSEPCVWRTVCRNKKEIMILWEENMTLIAGEYVVK